IQGSNILENLIVLEEGYKLLKEGKSDEASIKFMTIPSDSSIINIARALEHYRPVNKEEK
ncbi:MAG: hypothetical protein LBS73_06990, partial [Campylobacteraceae bacterium]|nr:hypothetical protein [Campylobacteraceae bacterium]